MADTELLDALVVVARACREGRWRWQDRASGDPSLSLSDRFGMVRFCQRLELLQEDATGVLAMLSAYDWIRGARVATERALRHEPEDPDAPAGRYS